MAAPIIYADSIIPDFGVPFNDQMVEALKTAPVEALHDFHAKQQFDPVMMGWRPANWDTVLSGWKDYVTHCVLGGNRCLHPDTPIYDPVLGICRRVKDIQGEHHVYAWDGQGFVVAKASAPFIKGYERMITLNLSNNQRLTVTPAHRVLTPSGWVSAGELRPGCELSLPGTTSGNGPLDRELDARRCFETAEGSPAGCHPPSRLCDEQPLSGQGSAQGVSPSQAGAPGHTSVCGSSRHRPSLSAFHSAAGTRDGPGQTPLCSHGEQRCARPAILDDLRRLAALFAGILCRSAYRLCKSVLRSLWGQGFLGVHQQSAVESVRLLSIGGFGPPGNQSLCVGSLPTQYNLGGNSFPVWDFEVADHHNYLCAGVVHHNSAKSTLMARLTLHLAMNIPGARIRCWSTNEESSINDQQRVIWENLPQGYKNLPKKRAVDASISYTQKNGFTGGKLILPSIKPGYPGSEVIFQTYRSWSNDPQVAEGWWAHWIWLDESPPAKLFETLLYRLYDARGRLGMSFTTLDGWTPIIATS